MREVGVAAGWGFMYKYTMGGSANVDDVLGKTTCQANVRGGGIDLFIESTERWAGSGIQTLEHYSSVCQQFGRFAQDTR
jgi:hypothetical protein